MKAGIFGIVLIVLLSVTLAQSADEVEYYAVFMEGAKVGYATHSSVVANGKVTTTETVDMTINRAGVAMSLKTKEICVETLKGEPISFVAEQDIGMGTARTEGTVGQDGIVQVQTKGMGEVQKNSFPWPKGAVMAEGLRLISMEKGLKEGTSYNVKMFSPGMMDAVDSRVSVGARQEVDLLGRVVTLTKVETTMSMPGTGEMTTVGFVDEELRALKSIMPMAGMKIEMVACEKTIALGDNEPLEIIDKMFLASPEPIIDAGSAKSITYYLKPVEGAGGFTIPAGDNQKVERLEDGTIKVVVEPVKAPAGGVFPYKGTDANIAEAIKPNRFLQSDDANIIALAKQATGDADGRREGLWRCGKKNRGVCGEIRKECKLVGWIRLGGGGGGKQKRRLYRVCGFVRGDVPVDWNTGQGRCGRGIHR